ncbi:hypothetical protein F0562_029204 [Nyssa sinensis]|uniref:Pentacotripeptide-repeat region of PRORP domain-containing protein n=1 Tax=Nyssa sinensis TaxID=561372 RepID=A0A5J5B3B1_9ASTE|nr:hypothetical protein F0562_029204 [Nyssa sinensis]
MAALQEAKLPQARVIVCGLHQEEIFLRKLITTFATTNPYSLNQARLLLNQIEHPSSYIYNTMFRAYAASSNPHQALILYNKMHRHDPSPDNYTFPFLVKSCSSLADLRKGKEIHNQAFKHGFHSDIFVQNSLIHLYGSNFEIKMAYWVFYEMGYRDIATWTTLMTCYADFYSIESAQQVFDKTPKRNVVSYSAMIAGYVRRNHFKEALELFQELLRAKMKPNDSTITSVLCARANLGALELDMFFKCGSTENALKIFEGAKEKYVGEWTAMLSGLAMHGLGNQLVEAFKEIVSSGVKPNAVTFVALLSRCTHSGLVNEGLGYFVRMTRQFGIEPTIEHFGCVVDLLGRAGLIEQAVRIIRDMPVEASAAIWGALLNACRVYKNVEVGELAASWLISNEPWNGALYMALLGLYREAGRCDDMEKVKREMKKIGCRKSPGCSLIEVNGICYEFVVGDKSHPSALEVCSNLGDIIMNTKENFNSRFKFEIYL